jgi:uncharacterized protein
LAEAAPGRVASLDLIRGVAVLGILAVNIAGLAGPSTGVYSPDVPHPGDLFDHAAFAAMLVLFEGKMRALFSILFGASLLLFVERKEDAGEDGQTLQLRRLGWLAVFGYLHFLLLWWGDILFLYAFAGVAVLALRHLPSPAMIAAALLMFTAWQLHGVFDDLPPALAEAAVTDHHATAEQTKRLADTRAYYLRQAQKETREYRSGFATQVIERLTDRPLYPFPAAFYSAGETIPYMLLGMLLMRSGFFSGGWRRRWLWALAIGGTIVGGGATLAFTAWAWPRGFPPEAMRLAVNYALSFPHVLMALGYAASLVLATKRLSDSALGQRFAAAGRMAFSNYLGTSLLMGTIFYGWGLDLFGRLDRLGMTGFMLLGWALMLAWSKPWLRRFRIGPLESLWRKLATGNLTRGQI